MKLFLLVMLVVGLAAGAYVLVNAEKVEEPSQVLADHQDVPGGTQEITCPLCNGEGRILRVSRKNNAESSETRYRCPLCYEKGGRHVVVPNGMMLCPNCYGMGYKAYLDKAHAVTRHNVQSIPPAGSQYAEGDGEFMKRPCGRCRGTGVIAPQHQQGIQE